MKKENWFMIAGGIALLAICIPAAFWLHSLAAVTQPIWYDSWGWFNDKEYLMGFPISGAVIGAALLLGGLTEDF